jgi:hypothetical protein
VRDMEGLTSLALPQPSENVGYSLVMRQFRLTGDVLCLFLVMWGHVWNNLQCWFAEGLRIGWYERRSVDRLIVLSVVCDTLSSLGNVLAAFSSCHKGVPIALLAH